MTAVLAPSVLLALVVPWWPDALVADVFATVVLGAVIFGTAAVVPALGCALAFGTELVAGPLCTAALVVDACGVVVDLRPCTRKGTIA